MALPGKLLGYISRMRKAGRPAIKAVKRLGTGGRIKRALGRAGRASEISQLRFRSALMFNPPVASSHAENIASGRRVGAALRSVEHHSKRVKKLVGMQVTHKVARAKAVERSAGAGAVAIGAAGVGMAGRQYMTRRRQEKTKRKG